MLILGARTLGRKHYVAAAFPSACGKTNFAMMVPPKRFAGWKITTIGDDIAWIRVGDDGGCGRSIRGRLLRRGPGPISRHPNAMESVRHDSIFTNVAMTKDGTSGGKARTINLRRADRLARTAWKRGSSEPRRIQLAFHGADGEQPHPLRVREQPEACPSRPSSSGPAGDDRPLVLQAMSWTHGVFLGATMGSETTAAAAGKVGVVRRDPWRCCLLRLRHGEYLSHWVSLQKRLTDPPPIFLVNWFRKDSDGKFSGWLRRQRAGAQVDLGSRRRTGKALETRSASCHERGSRPRDLAQIASGSRKPSPSTSRNGPWSSSRRANSSPSTTRPCARIEAATRAPLVDGLE